MTRIQYTKPNHLIVMNLLATKFNVGNVLTSTWLKKHNISAKLAWWYVHSGWLERIGHQVYKKSNVEVNWSSAIAAVQTQLNLPVHIGGKTALEILGKAHFVPLGDFKKVTLFAAPKTNLPKWLFDESIWNAKFSVYQPLLCSDNSSAIIEAQTNDDKVLVSSPELAILEVLYLAPNEESFEGACLLMQGLRYLRPNIVQILLETCNSIKIKRLFLYLADKYQHPWLKYLDLNKIALGTGKCVVGGGGNYNAKYKISVPMIYESY